MIKENQKILNRIQVLLDQMILVVALIMAYYIRFYDYTGEHLTFSYYLRILYLLIPLHMALYFFMGLYEPRRKKKITKELVSIIKANVMGMVILLSLLYFFKEINYSRQVLLLFIVLNCTLISLERIALKTVLHQVRKRGFNKKFILIIGAGSLTRKVIKKTKENPNLGYEILGIVDDLTEVGKAVSGIKIIAKISDLENVLQERLIDEIVIALPLKEYDKLRMIIKQCEKSGVRTSIIPDYSRYIPARPMYEEIDGIPLLNIRYVPLDNVFNAWRKRVFDIALSGLGILICLPVYLIIAVAIKLDDPSGPVLYKQERVGLNKKNFQMYKFRSMKLQEESPPNPQWTTANDKRKTKVGTFIRKTSIDELPQLFNVFKGEMSLVGPRPERPFFVNRFREKVPKYMIKHYVRPGMTGWAQVNGWRGDTSIRRRIEHDIYYIENWTFSFDIKIMLLTVKKGLVHKNAY